MNRSLLFFVAAFTACFAGLLPRQAHAFCGFYVSGADAKLLAEATQVVLMRDGTRTVLSMQNDYKGPPEGFAMVVPVPVVLQKENVKTLPRDVFDRVDKLSAPRLVEYWEQDPCPTGIGLGDIGNIGLSGATGGFGYGRGRLGGEHKVTIEAQFEVGEYEILILSAQDSSGLDSWLREKGYKIPANAEPALRPYVQAGSKFFVAKVNVAKVKFEGGRASLSPLRFHYDSEKFELPVRLGMLNSGGTQDLVVHVLAPSQRYVVTNYPSVTIPTNLDVAEAARGSFPAFYAALLDRTLEKTPGAIVTEYAWPSSSCDPCPGGVSGLSGRDLATLGADVLPSTSGSLNTITSGGSGGPSLRQGAVTVSAGLPPEVIQRIVRQNYGRFRLCYEGGLARNASLAGQVGVSLELDSKGEVASTKDAGSDMPDKGVVDCVVRSFKNITFPAPQNTAKVSVVYRIAFSPASPSAGGGGRFGSSLGSFVLTRLHARYGKDSLGNDLVFKAAPAIVGGREIRSEQGALETGSVPASVNSFQARYVIRHEWKGPIACKEPRRGVWGGPPGGTTADSSPLAAQKLAYAPRGNVTLAAFVPGGVPELAMVAGAAPPAGDGGVDAAADPDAGGASVVPSSRPSRCGCRTVGAAPSGASSIGAGVAVAMLALARQRRRLRRT